MKYTLLLSSAILLFLTNNCKRLDKLTQFNMPYNETIVIPASIGVNIPFNVTSPDISTNSEGTFEVNDTRKDLIEEIRLSKLDLTLTSPSGGDLGFLKSIKVILAADGLPEIKVAYKDSVDPNIGSYIELDIAAIDLKEYLKKEKFSLKVNTVTDEVITSDHHIDVHSVFFVDAKVLGQ